MLHLRNIENCFSLLLVPFAIGVMAIMYPPLHIWNKYIRNETKKKYKTIQTQKRNGSNDIKYNGKPKLPPFEIWLRKQ